MTRFRMVLALLGATLIAPLAPALADMQLPGLAADANAYVSGLTGRYPTGATSPLRAAAEQKASTAATAGKWADAAAALEDRVGMGSAQQPLWQALARAQLRLTPPNAARALQAAFRAWQISDHTGTELPSLLLMADALHVLARPVQEIEVLRQAAELLPDNKAVATRLADTTKVAGMLVSRLAVEGQSDPARACLAFTVPPTRAAEFSPGDWVRLDPPVPDAAVTREGDQICVSGLPSGRITRILLRAGLPATGALSMLRDSTTAVAMPNRDPNIGFDARLFVLPRGQASALSISTVNMSAVKLRLLRLTERNVALLLRQVKLGQPIERWTAENLGEQVAAEVWTGRADIPGFALNKTVRTKLPLPDALANSGPGLYALIATLGDGNNSGVEASAIQLVLRTDLAPSVWRGTDGLTVQIRDYGSALPRDGVKLRLLSTGNDILAETTTDADGVGKFAAPLLRGQGPSAPGAIHAFAVLSGGGEDFAALDLNAAAFDLSDRGVEGMPHPGPFDAYLWPDRGIYRPGETVQLMALVRDAAGQPADLPAQVTVRRPNGQVFLQTVPPRGGDASISLPIALSPGAPAGVWNVELRADPLGAPIGQTSFRVDAFVPERLAVDLGKLPDTLVQGQTAQIPVTARFLYGAPGNALSGIAHLHLVIDSQPFPALAGSRIGVEGEAFAPDQASIDFDETDAQGRTNVPVTLAAVPDTTQALKAELDIAINDVAGRASHARATLPIRPATPLIGIKPLFADNAIDADTEAGFEVAAVSPLGTRIEMKARVRLVRERPDWHMVMNGNVARYETTWRDEPMETREVTIPADSPLKIARKLPFGRYRLEVAQAGGLALTTIRFRSGWATSDIPDVPDRVDVSVDRRVVPAGQTARVHIASPFAGKATVLVLSDRVHSLRDIDVPAAGTDIDVPVEAAWGPGAYVTVHVFRPGQGNDRPGRAIGLVWVGVDPAARQLPLAIEAPGDVVPRVATTVVVRSTPGAWVTLAAVDEGILRLTRYVSPDAGPHFLGRRRLGLDIRDDWGRLLPPAEGDATLLRQGGDDGGFVLPDIPVRTVSLFTPPTQVGPDGRAVISLAIPDFAGSVRLMAMGWMGPRIGAANTDMLVRDPLIAEALLPRFLAPGDEARLSVLLQNIALPAGPAAVKISLDGPLALGGADTLSANLTVGARAVPSTVLRATGAGRGVVKLAITGPGGFMLNRETAITIRPSRAAQTIVVAGELAPGAEVRLDPPIASFTPGTWSATATLGAPVRYDPAAMQKALDDYIWSCLEQATSRGLALAMMPRGPEAAAGVAPTVQQQLDSVRAGRLQKAVQLVLERQRYDGGFGLWSGEGEAQPWLSSYALDFLLRARAAGATVPAQAMADGLKFLAGGAESNGTEAPELAAQAYRLYVLAAAGQARPGAQRVLMENLERMPTPLSRAQLGAAFALSHDRPRAEAAFGAGLLAPARGWWYEDYGSAVRDQLATAVLLKESGLLPDRLAQLMARLPGADFVPAGLNTQEQAWAAAAAVVLGQREAATKVSFPGTPNVTFEPTSGRAGMVMRLTGPLSVRNDGDKPIWRSLAITGVPLQAPPAGRAGMRITRKFLNLDGSDLNLDTLKQNAVFVLVLEGRVEDGQSHQAMLMQGLPAGWEIAGRIAPAKEGEKLPGMPWMDTLSETDAQPAADDRFAAIVTTKGDVRVAVRLRAVTPGSFVLPGAEMSDMYRPAVFARQAEGRIQVLPPE